MRLRVRAAGDGFHPTTAGRDTPLCTHCLRRDTHLQRESNRYRLQVSVQRIKNKEPGARNQDKLV